ncbi:MAG TPA: LamG-like jellyroll fold domain-containing protein [Opitutaceae bacterium]|nr:LamG-like jellyroll fold domain-containing protein [Opitutaceae bacterium]
MLPRYLSPLLTLAVLVSARAASPAPEPGLLFYLSADHGTTADYSAAGTPKPTYQYEVTPIADGARNGALQCGNYQLLAYRAPGNIYAQRGTLSFFWRSRYPVGPTAFPVFRVGYGDHSSWDMVFLRVDYNGHGFDAFVTDANLSRTRVSVPLDPFPAPKAWTHLAVAWDETRGLRFYINGRLAAHVDTKARYDLALDQFGPHSRIISPHQVQSDYNYVRGGDIDEVRIYDHMLDDDQIAALAHASADASASVTGSSFYPRSLATPAVNDEWAFRYGWNRAMPPELPAGPGVAVRKVEIHQAYDLKRWWWKANDGIVETTWPGVYNRSRLPGRNDYFQLPDWDCYVQSGKAVTFKLPKEPVNHIEITGAAWGKMELLPSGTDLEHAYLAQGESVLFDRPEGQEKTVNTVTTPLAGREIRFTNVEQEQPIAELGAYDVTSGAEPAGSHKLAFKLVPHGSVGQNGMDASLRPLETYIAGRYAPDERGAMLAVPADSASMTATPSAEARGLPLVHVLVPDSWDNLSDGLDGVAIDLPALNVAPTRDGLVALNIQVKDPLWPARNLLDFTFSVRPGEARTLWLDTRDRLLPAGKPLWISVASSSPDFNADSLAGATLRLVFKPHDAARAEHIVDRFTEVKDVYAMMTEEHPHDVRLAMWNRFKGDLDDLLRVDPTNKLGLEYRAFGVPGAPRPAFHQPEPPPGVPLWAFRQVTLLGQVKHFVNWYIDHRQVGYGDFGGGISDDVDLLNTWPGVALMGCDPDKLAKSDAALLDAAFKNGMFTNGLPTIQADELHSYEEGINCLGQNLILNFGSPKVIERAMGTARGVYSITGINAAGHRHIRTSYYSGSKQATEDPWGFAKPYSYLVLQVPQLLVNYNGNPWTKKYLLELADGLLAHHHPNAKGHGAAVPAIHFSDDREEDVGRGYFPWHVFWAAYKFTGDHRYLTPILDGGMTSLANVNADVLDELNLRRDWGARLERGERAVTIEGRRPAGRTKERTSGYRASNSDQFEWQLTGDKTYLEKLYADQIETCALLDYINTKGSLWIDRVGVPYAELQRARLGGVALVRNALFPGHVVSWRFAAPANDQSVAILVPDATPTAIKVIAYNLDQTPVHATMTGWNIEPGVWEITQGVDSRGTDNADSDISTWTAPFEQSKSIELTLPPRTTTILTLKLKTPGTPYWQRPDIGIDPQDVVVRENTVHVRVHSLGSVPAPATSLAVLDANGHVIASAKVPAIDAPLDLEPKTTEVTLEVPAGASLQGASVELDSDHQLDEITTMNNVVKL